MRKIISILLFAICAVSCESITGEGPVLTNDYTVSSTIEAIHVGSALLLELSDDIEVGEIKIETYSNLFEYINFEKSGSNVSIYMENERYKGDVTVVVYASSRQFRSVDASGASYVTLKDVPPFTTYKLYLSGASIFIAEENFNALSSLKIYASGSSYASIVGSAGDCVVDASGASYVSGANFTCEDLDLQLSGSSSLKIKVNSSVNGSLSGASTLYYSGSPQFDDINTSGSASIKRF